MIETLRREDSELRSTITTQPSPYAPYFNHYDEFLDDIHEYAEMFNKISITPPGALADPSHEHSKERLLQSPATSSLDRKEPHIDPVLVSAVDEISCIHSDGEESYVKPSYYAIEAKRHRSMSARSSPQRSKTKPSHDVFEILYKDAIRAKEHRRRLEEIFYPADEHIPKLIGNKHLNIQVSLRPRNSFMM